MSQPLHMTFVPGAAQACLDGLIRVVRRPAKPCDYIQVSTDKDGNEQTELITSVYSLKTGAKEKVIYRTGETISVIPARGFDALGKVLVTDLGLGLLRNITDEEVALSGFEPATRENYFMRWKHMYVSSKYNPITRIIRFKPIDIQRSEHGQT
jgi:hypothetical protein